MFFARSFATASLMGLLALTGFGSTDANAQQIFRIVGPDGRVTFSDKAPTDPGVRATAGTALRMPAAGGTDINALPLELRQAATRYPVTLYTASGCMPCGGGRALLSSRGVPFTEKTVSTNEDILALQRLSGGASSLPFLTVGGQQIRGYSEIEWTQFLDAAGYPKTSQLPANYSPAPPSPLVAAQDPLRSPPPAAAEPERAAAPSEVAPGRTPENPTGLKF
ncbi:MAG: glutaredoxin-like protein [Ramlibacter sp.]|nr:glutaredoxin-like protein [Ramlibacter sp.]